MDHHCGAGQEGRLDGVQGVGGEEGGREGQDQMLGDEQLLSEPEPCVNLLPQ